MIKKWTKTAGLLFMAASSVYYGQAVVAAPGKSAPAASQDKSNTSTNVRLLDDLLPPAGGADKTPADPNVVTGAKAPADPNAATSANNSTDKSAAVTDLTASSDTKPAATTATPADGKSATDAAAAPTTRSEGRSVSKSEVNVSDEGTVEIHVNDASLVEVLRMLSLQSQKNIICSKEVRGTVTANLYNVTIREALDQVLHMNGYAYREKGNFINVYTVKELQQIEDAERKAQTEVFRLHYTPAANVLTLVKPILSPTGQAAATTAAVAGIASGGTDVGGNSHAVEDMIVVTDFPDNLDRIRKVLKELDRRPQQVLVEATILRASLSEDNALGVDFNVLAGVKFTDFLNQNGQFTNATVDPTKASVSSSAGSIGTGNSFTSTVPGGMKVGFVSDNVSVFLAALEGTTDTVVLGNPKILALNKQKGEVIVGRKDGYVTSTTTDTATVQTVEFLDTGTRLVFRPFISDDGFVRMELHPEDSSGGLTGAGLPFKITTELTSNIMVKDGHTIVIGGLFRESSDSARSQTPFLGNIPVAGALFRNQRDRSTREEIIILLTPHIIKDDDIYGKLSEEEIKRADQLRVGVRKGMMPWGRERLAEGEYDKALAELNKPHPNNQKALWHLDCATNLNPKFIEAIELKQKVTGKEVTAVDGSTIRSFVRDMVMADREPGSVPPPSRTEGEQQKPKATNTSAAAEPGDADADADSLANADGEEMPLDQVSPDQEPDYEMPADQGLVNEPAADDKPATTQSTTQPVAANGKPATTQPSVAAKPQQGDKKDAAAADPVEVIEDTASTTATKSDKKPGDAKDTTGPGFTVTELPTEEVKPDAPPADDNK
ncbi:MAG TPA: secretin and TonB N-terminal domain-containing protein [Tepidisphaeraceae bacterium]